MTEETGFDASYKGHCEELQGTISTDGGPQAIHGRRAGFSRNVQYRTDFLSDIRHDGKLGI
jgi:hypothetical protein